MINNDSWIRGCGWKCLKYFIACDDHPNYDRGNICVTWWCHARDTKEDNICMWDLYLWLRIVKSWGMNHKVWTYIGCKGKPKGSTFMLLFCGVTNGFFSFNEKPIKVGPCNKKWKEKQLMANAWPPSRPVGSCIFKFCP